MEIGFLFYYYSFYNIGYSTQTIRSINQLKSKGSFTIIDFPVIQSLVEVNKCSVCNKITTKISIPFYKISFCKFCSFEAVKALMSKRVSFMNKENFQSREYYTNGFEIIFQPECNGIEYVFSGDSETGLSC